MFYKLYFLFVCSIMKTYTNWENVNCAMAHIRSSRMNHELSDPLIKFLQLSGSLQFSRDRIFFFCFLFCFYPYRVALFQEFNILTNSLKCDYMLSKIFNLFKNNPILFKQQFLKWIKWIWLPFNCWNCISWRVLSNE